MAKNFKQIKINWTSLEVNVLWENIMGKFKYITVPNFYKFKNDSPKSITEQ